MLERWRYEHASFKKVEEKHHARFSTLRATEHIPLLIVVGYCNIRYFELCVNYQATSVVQVDVDVYFMKTNFHSPVHFSSFFEIAVSVRFR